MPLPCLHHSGALAATNSTARQGQLTSDDSQAAAGSSLTWLQAQAGLLSLAQLAVQGGDVLQGPHLLHDLRASAQWEVGCCSVTCCRAAGPPAGRVSSTLHQLGAGTRNEPVAIRHTDAGLPLDCNDSEP